MRSAIIHSKNTQKPEQEIGTTELPQQMEKDTFDDLEDEDLEDEDSYEDEDEDLEAEGGRRNAILSDKGTQWV